MTISLVGLDPFLANLIQTGAIERIIKEALVNRTIYRTDVMAEDFGGKIGETKLISRSGLLPVNIAALAPGVDPVPAAFARESFRSTLSIYGGTVDAYLPHDYAGVVKESAEKSQKIGVNAAQTIDRLIRSVVHRCYLAGNTCATAAFGIGAGSPRPCGPSPPWAGRRTPPTCGASTPPRCWSPPTTSCSSGWPA